MEGDAITGVHFLLSGEGAFVLPIFDNVNYISIQIGDHFVLNDIFGSTEQLGVNFDKWYSIKGNLLCQFTIQANVDCEIHVLSLEDIQKMK